MKLFLKQLILLVAGFMLASCSLPGGNIPADHFYRLPVALPVTTATNVVIQPVRAEGLYNERALLFVEQSRPLELQRYDYHFWAQTPAQLAQHYLQGCMPQIAANKQPSLQLAVTITSFERVVESGKAVALVKLRINNREYIASVAANAMDMHATVEAFGAAMQQVCETAARDL